MQPPIHVDTIRPEPTLVKYHFMLSPTKYNFRSKTAFVRSSQRFDKRKKWKLHNACNPELADHTTHRAKPAKPAHPALCLRIKLRGALPSARRPLLPVRHQRT